MSGCWPWWGGSAAPPPAFVPIAFDWTYFSATFPELVGAGQTFANGQFVAATLMLDNSGAGRVPGYGGGSTYPNPNGAGSLPNPLFLALHWLTAHLVALNGTGILGAAAGQPASTLVGRISSATEGSVTVQTDMQSVPGSEQWFRQTKYGATYWQMVAPYRGAFWVRGPSSRGRRWP